MVDSLAVVGWHDYTPALNAYGCKNILLALDTFIFALGARFLRLLAVLCNFHGTGVGFSC
jgi:hypothetical protein